MKQITNNVSKHVPIVLAGNKWDLGDTERYITPEEGKQLATKFDLEFYEISALDGTNIQLLFSGIVKKIVEYKINTATSISENRFAEF